MTRLHWLAECLRDGYQLIVFEEGGHDVTTKLIQPRDDARLWREAADLIRQLQGQPMQLRLFSA